MKAIYAFVFVVLFGCATNTATAAIDVFMRIKDANGALISGESVNANFKNWIEINDYGSNAQVPFTTGAGGTSAGKPTLEYFKFQAPFTSASLPLSKAMYSGARLQEVDIYFVKTGAECNCAFYKIHMEDVYVGAITEAKNDESISQEISFKPTQIAWAYYKQSVNGTYPSSPSSVFGWDFSTNRVYSYNF